MKAWVEQDYRQKQKLGDACPWTVRWFDHDGRKRSKRIGTRENAEKFRARKEIELEKSLVQAERIPWKRFRQEYEETVFPTWRSPYSRIEATHALDKFAEVAKPKYVDRITERTLDDYVAKRLKARGKRAGETISPETIRKEMRTIRAALNKAVRWGYLAKCPCMPDVAGYGKDKPFVTDQHFDLMMAHCDAARLPSDQHFSAEQFWKALLGMAWVTGMRKSALLSLRWEDVDLDAGVVISRAKDNKQKRDQRHKIAAAVPLLRELHNARRARDPRVFPWNYAVLTLSRTLHAIQAAAGIELPCREDHEHTDACHRYGFHSFRYAHATYNFGRVPDRALQEQMGHASFTTTTRYIKYAEQHQQQAYDAYLPPSLKAKE